MHMPLTDPGLTWTVWEDIIMDVTEKLRASAVKKKKPEKPVAHWHTQGKRPNPRKPHSPRDQKRKTVYNGGKGRDFA
jgi:hypothetical protein